MGAPPHALNLHGCTRVKQRPERKGGGPKRLTREEGFGEGAITPRGRGVPKKRKEGGGLSCTWDKC